jgi:hypothetical protein
MIPSIEVDDSLFYFTIDEREMRMIFRRGAALTLL